MTARPAGPLAEADVDVTSVSTSITSVLWQKSISLFSRLPDQSCNDYLNIKNIILVMNLDNTVGK